MINDYALYLNRIDFIVFPFYTMELLYEQE